MTVAPVIDEEKGTILFKVNDEATDDDLKSLTPIIEISEKLQWLPKVVSHRIFPLVKLLPIQL